MGSNLVKNCETCKKEHNGVYGSGRFCSSHCARKFSTKNDDNKKCKIVKCINCSVDVVVNKRHDPLRVKCDKCKSEKNCIYCGDKYYSSRKKMCNTCKKWYKYVELYKKVNVYDDSLSLKVINKKALNLLFDLYFNKKLSSLDINERLGIRVNSLFFYFKKNGINFRTLSESQTNLILTKDIPISIQNNTYKHGWYTTWNNKQVYYRSSYELKFAQYLDSNKILYDMESIKILYFDTQKQKYRVAIPDFYLPCENKIIEIKSDWTLDEQNMKDKELSYIENGYTFQLIRNEKELDNIINMGE